MNYDNLSDKPLCACGEEAEIIDSTPFECDDGEAWHDVTCKCPKCGLVSVFQEVFAHPRYELLGRDKE